MVFFFKKRGNGKYCTYFIKNLGFPVDAVVPKYEEKLV